MENIFLWSDPLLIKNTVVNNVKYAFAFRSHFKVFLLYNVLGL